MKLQQRKIFCLKAISHYLPVIHQWARHTLLWHSASVFHKTDLLEPENPQVATMSVIYCSGEVLFWFFCLFVFNCVYAFSCGTHRILVVHSKQFPSWWNHFWICAMELTLGVSNLQSRDPESSISGYMEWISVQPSKVAFCMCTRCC